VTGRFLPYRFLFAKIFVLAIIKIKVIKNFKDIKNL